MNVETIINKCDEKYSKEDIETIKRISEKLDKIIEPDDSTKKDLTMLQGINNKWYTNYGLTSVVLDFQVLINEYRYKFDIPDESEVVTVEGGKQFVQ